MLHILCCRFKRKLCCYLFFWLVHIDRVDSYYFLLFFSIHGLCKSSIIMFDVTSRLNYKNVPTWQRHLQAFLSGRPGRWRQPFG
ncbi:hypothetical protein ACQJBY_014062 [Aegilops geniculata]